MTKTRLIGPFLLVLAGCATSMGDVQQANVLAPPSSATRDCPSWWPDFRWSCKVELDVNQQGQLILTTDPIVVPRPGDQQKVVITWTLKGNDFYFGSGDGVFVQRDGQFENACPVGSDDKCTTAARPKKFRLWLKNDAEFSLPYCVRFRSSDAHVFEFDPTIANSFGFMNKAAAPINPSPCRL